VIVVLDNLNTHTKGAFCEAFEPDRARAYIKRIKAVPADAPSLGHSKQEQVESLERFRHLREEPARFPARLRSLTGRGVGGVTR
jgi:hypothetical protein